MEKKKKKIWNEGLMGLPHTSWGWDSYHNFIHFKDNCLAPSMGSEGRPAREQVPKHR